MTGPSRKIPGADENVGAPVTATDADTDTLTYKLSGVDAPSFSIVDSSGQIQTKAPLDHEAKATLHGYGNCDRPIR